MTSGFFWKTPPEKAFGGLTISYERQVKRAVAAIMLQRAPQIRGWLQVNAPWKDHTGNARQTLNTFVVELADAIVVTLTHGMDYGIYLETKNAGRYAIIAPGVDYWAPILLEDVRALLR